MEVDLPIEPDAEFPEIATQPSPPSPASSSQSSDGSDSRGLDGRLGALPSIHSRGASPANSGDEAEEADALQLDRDALKKRSQAILDSAVDSTVRHRAHVTSNATSNPSG